MSNPLKRFKVRTKDDFKRRPPVEEMDRWPIEKLATLPTYELMLLSPMTLRKLPAETLSCLPVEGLNRLDAITLARLDPATIGRLGPSKLFEVLVFDPSLLRLLTKEQIAGLRPADLARLPHPALFRYLPPALLVALMKHPGEEVKLLKDAMEQSIPGGFDLPPIPTESKSEGHDSRGEYRGPQRATSTEEDQSSRKDLEVAELREKMRELHIKLKAEHEVAAKRIAEFIKQKNLNVEPDDDDPVAWLFRYINKFYDEADHNYHVALRNEERVTELTTKISTLQGQLEKQTKKGDDRMDDEVSELKRQRDAAERTTSKRVAHYLKKRGSMFNEKTDGEDPIGAVFRLADKIRDEADHNYAVAMAAEKAEVEARTKNAVLETRLRGKRRNIKVNEGEHGAQAEGWTVDEE